MLYKFRVFPADNTETLSQLTVALTNEDIFPVSHTKKFRVGHPKWCIFNLSFQVQQVDSHLTGHKMASACLAILFTL